MGIVASLTAIKRPDREAGHSPPYTAEVKNVGAQPPLPIYLRGVEVN
jgi:hypothetical protein